MKRASYKRVSGSRAGYVQDRERHRGIYCISAGWHKWAKRWLSKYNRRQCDIESFEENENETDVCFSREEE